MADPGYYFVIHVEPTQLSPWTPGHVAVSIVTPDGSIYAGFGPNHSRGTPVLGHTYAGGQVDVQFLPPGGRPNTLPLPNGNPNFSTASDGPVASKSFRIPISAWQAAAATAEIARVATAAPDYNFFDMYVCSAVADQIARAAGVGPLPSLLPASLYIELEAISDALAKNPAATMYLIGKEGNGLSAVYTVPGGLHGLLQDKPVPPGSGTSSVIFRT